MIFGKLALSAGQKLPLQVLKSNAGYYIGTTIFVEDSGWHEPYSRESVEYFPSEESAKIALTEGSFTQKRSF